MKITVEITDTKQKIKRVYHTGWNVSDDPQLIGLEFMWSEGNYSCDCNRSLFFQEAGGVEDPYRTGPEHPDYSDCNTGPNRFLVKVMDDTGNIIHED